MIVLNVMYTMKDGVSPADFVKALEDSGQAPFCRQEKGNICYDYYYPCDGSPRLLLLERWEDAESLAAHAKTDNFAAIGRTKEIYVEHTEIQKYVYEA